MTFTEEFEMKSMEEKDECTGRERNARMVKDLDKYIPLPVCIPVMSRMVPQPIDFKLAWMIGIPRDKPIDENNPTRDALTVGMPNEECAMDMCDALNTARRQRFTLS